MLLISGWLLVFLGIILSFTGIGACLGIPMIVVGMPLWIIGAILMWQGKVKRAEEAIAAGVRQGIQQAQATISGQQAAVRPPMSTPPSPPPASEHAKAPLPPPPPPPKALFVPPSPQPSTNEPAKVSLPPATPAQPQPPAPTSEPVKSPQSVSTPVPLTSQKPISKIVWIGIVAVAVIALGAFAWYSYNSSKASKRGISNHLTDWSRQSKGVAQEASVIFADNFNDNSIDLSKWKASGNTVTEANQMMQVLTAVTDAGGSLTSVAIPVNSTGKVTITRRVRLHYGNSYFMGQFGITIGTLPMFSIRYANMDYADGSTYMRRIGFFIARNNARPDLIANQADVSAAITPLWDTWFNERITYSPITGIMEYFINNVSQLTFNVGTMPQTTSPTMSLNFNAWGWYTGHSLLFSDLQVTQEKNEAENKSSSEESTHILDSSTVGQRAVPSPATSSHILSPDLQAVVTLSQKHLNDEIITAYIKSSGKSYKLKSEDIIYLSHQGVSQGVISALLQTETPAKQNP